MSAASSLPSDVQAILARKDAEIAAARLDRLQRQGKAPAQRPHRSANVQPRPETNRSRLVRLLLTGESVSSASAAEILQLSRKQCTWALSEIMIALHAAGVPVEDGRKKGNAINPGRVRVLDIEAARSALR